MRRALTLAAGALLAVLASATAWAEGITVFGLAEGRAIVTLTGGKMKVLRPGDQLAEGIKLLAADRAAAIFLMHGKKHRFTIGDAITATESAPAKTAPVILSADESGHFFAEGRVNGGMLRFLVDTGATHILINPTDARRLGIDYTKGKAGMSNTAGGMIRIWRVKLDEVRIGNLTAHNVDAVVSEQDSAPFALLGMSFLQRMRMDRDGDRLTLSQRF